MPIKYGTTTISTVKYGSTAVNVVYYGSTRVFPSNVTISVFNTDTFYGRPFISTDPQATSGSTSLTVLEGTTVYFFMQITTAPFPTNLRAKTWVHISGGMWPDYWQQAVYRLGQNSCIYTSSSNAAYNGFIRLTSSDGGYVAREDKNFQIQARTLTIGEYQHETDRITWFEELSEDEYSDIAVRNDYSSITVSNAYVYGEYYWYQDSSGNEFEDWDFKNTKINTSTYLFTHIYHEGDMQLEFTVYDKDKNYNPVYVDLTL